ncbi:hypothetical protein CPB84DRAFT_235259 [Gymnopilus junonius]|uniref:Uncharacterized protein n=1 Tax=Gymnopilus junonius TaxID=109634 RepID=A0A9P5THG3_GYMJU|nr:hypothetical protein CPB84DRAFT_235259 [Gymnopilus junonius]
MTCAIKTSGIPSVPHFAPQRYVGSFGKSTTKARPLQPWGIKNPHDKTRFAHHTQLETAPPFMGCALSSGKRLTTRGEMQIMGGHLLPAVQYREVTFLAPRPVKSEARGTMDGVALPETSRCTALLMCYTLLWHQFNTDSDYVSESQGNFLSFFDNHPK